MAESPALGVAIMEVVKNLTHEQLELLTQYLNENSALVQNACGGDDWRFDLYLQIFEDAHSAIPPPSDSPDDEEGSDSPFAGKTSDNPRERKKRREDNPDAAFTKFLTGLRTSLGDHVAENLVWPALSDPVEALRPLSGEDASLDELTAALQSAKQVIQFRHVATPAEAYFTGGVVFLYAKRCSPKHVTMRSEAFVRACEEIGLHTRTVWSRVSFYRLAVEFPRLLCWSSFSLNVFLKYQTRLRIYLRCLTDKAEVEFWKGEVGPAPRKEGEYEEAAAVLRDGDASALASSMASPNAFPALDQQFLDSLLTAQAIHEPVIFFD